MDNRVLVSISMITYQHEKYIAQAIEGVLMQKGDFDIELVIANDCSPDKTDEIVSEYIAKHPRGNSIKYYKHQINIGALQNFVFAIQKCTGKYIAFCDGDDYWVDPLKLQKQINFLEANSDYGLIFTNFEINLNDRILPTNIDKNIPTGYIFKILLVDKLYVLTLTVCAHRDLIVECADIILTEALNKKWKQADYPLWVEMSLRTKFMYLPDKTAHYRRLIESAAHSPDKRKNYEYMKCYYEIKEFFIDREGMDEDTRTKIKCQYYIHTLLYGINLDDKKMAYEAYVFLNVNYREPISKKLKVSYWAVKYDIVWALVQIAKKMDINKLLRLS